MNRVKKLAIRHYFRRRAGEDIALVAAGIGLGAGLMYLCDPDRGRGRRGRLTGEASGILHRGENALSRHSKDLVNRMRGVAARAAAEIGPADAVDDEILLERVKSRMGHLLPHSHEVEVQVRNGVVHLKGRLARGDRRHVLEEVRGIGGVKRLSGHFRPLSTFRPGFVVDLAGGGGPTHSSQT